MTRALIVVACLVVIFAGMKAAASLVVPFLLAVFIAILLAPPYLSVKRRGLPSALAIVLMLAVLGVVGTLLVTVLKTALDHFIANLPSYEDSLRVRLDTLWIWLEEKGVEAPKDFVAENMDPRFAMQYAGQLARSLSGIFGNALLVLIVVAFILVEIGGLDRKLRSIPTLGNETLDKVRKNFDDVRRYVSLKSITSLLTGLLVAVWLRILDVDNAVFMGLLAFLLNFVPNIGSFIAAVPGVLLAFILLGPTIAIITAAGYVVINVGVSNVVEPRFMGESLGISPLVVIVSLIFWGWILGPIGMLLSIPLTMAVKAGLESSAATQPMAILLGAPPEESSEDVA